MQTKFQQFLNTDKINEHKIGIVNPTLSLTIMALVAVHHQGNNFLFDITQFLLIQEQVPIHQPHHHKQLSHGWMVHVSLLYTLYAVVSPHSYPHHNPWESWTNHTAVPCKCNGYDEILLPRVQYGVCHLVVNAGTSILVPSHHFDGLTHWGRDKLAAVSQTTYSHGFSWMKVYELWWKFHWSLLLRI